MAAPRLMAPSSMKPSTVSFASTQALVSMVPISSPEENGGPRRARRRRAACQRLNAIRNPIA